MRFEKMPYDLNPCRNRLCGGRRCALASDARHGTRFLVNFENVGHRARLPVRHPAEGLFHHGGDAGKSDFTLQESFDGDFVRRV